MTEDSEGGNKQKARSPFRVYVAVLIGIVVAVYTLGVVFGLFPTDRKIDTVNLLLIVLAIVVIVALLSPETVERVTKLELGTGGIKVEIAQVKEKQAQQEEQLNNFAEILRLVLPKSDQQILLNIVNEKNTDYPGDHPTHTGLRHLRSLNLIEMVNKRHVHDMSDANKKYNLLEYVRATDDGRHWAKIIEENKQEDTDHMETEKQKAQ